MATSERFSLDSELPSDDRDSVLRLLVPTCNAFYSTMMKFPLCQTGGFTQSPTDINWEIFQTVCTSSDGDK